MESRCPVQVALGVATQGSHRPVRAQLRHTVPPVMDSPQTVHRHTPTDAIRWPCGDVRSRVDALGTGPANESMTRRPLAVFPSLHRVLLGRVPRLPRYYEDAKPSCIPLAALRCLRLAIPVMYLVFRSHPTRRYLPDGPGVLVRLSPYRRYTGDDRTSHVPGEAPTAHSPCSSTPAGPLSLTLAERWRGPPQFRQGGRLAVISFRGSIARLLSWLSTLRRWVTLPGARLASGGWLGPSVRAFTRRASFERFPSIYCDISFPFPRLVRVATKIEFCTSDPGHYRRGDREISQRTATGLGSKANGSHPLPNSADVRYIQRNTTAGHLDPGRRQPT